jgi:sulfur carrier protein ThiS adenylyltransferase
MSEPTDRFIRQGGLVPRQKLQELKLVTVIGVGAIGRQVAIQLAAIGVGKVQLFDFDAVDETNITTQGFLADEVGTPKVLAVSALMNRIDPQIAVSAINDRYRPKYDVGEAVFCCVDSISAREAIWNQAGQFARFWVDGRMLGETIRVLSVGDGVGLDYYPTTIFKQEEAEQGRCTARSTIYTANIAAGLMLSSFTRWLRGIPVTSDVLLNLLADELMVTDALTALAPTSTTPEESTPSLVAAGSA